MNHPAWPWPFNKQFSTNWLTILTHLRVQQEQSSSPGARRVGTPHGSGRAGLGNPGHTHCPSPEQLGNPGGPTPGYWAPAWLCGCLGLGCEPLVGTALWHPWLGRAGLWGVRRLVLLLGSRAWWRWCGVLLDLYSQIPGRDCWETFLELYCNISLSTG